MFNLMLFALIAAGFANVCAQTAELSRKTRIAAHHRSGVGTGRRTVNVQTNALHHLIQTLLTKTHVGARFETLNAPHTRLNVALLL